MVHTSVQRVTVGADGDHAHKGGCQVRLTPMAVQELLKALA